MCKFYCTKMKENAVVILNNLYQLQIKYVKVLKEFK